MTQVVSASNKEEVYYIGLRKYKENTVYFNCYELSEQATHKSPTVNIKLDERLCYGLSTSKLDLRELTNSSVVDDSHN